MLGSTPDFLQQLELETGRLTTVPVSNLHLSIPHIEGWTVQAVLGHLGWVCRYANSAVQADPENPPSRADVAEPPPGPEVIEWYTEGQADLLATIERLDLDRMVPTWTGPRPGAWWLRRMAHEASMHRWDAMSASGGPEPINAGLARDGIDEVFEVFAPARMQFDTLGGAGETIHLHATDIDDGEWLVTIGPDSIEWSHGHDKGDVAARGPVADLLLLIWSRLPASRLEVFGDATLLERWQAAAAF